MNVQTAHQQGRNHRLGSQVRVDRVADDTLVPLLKDHIVPMATLHERYGPLLELVRVLIGVVPNCDTYLEIWPPAFRTYNIMVPNLLNLPFSVFGVGSTPKDMVGLGLYVASRAAECPYCSAHTCSFALRRGAVLSTVAHALDRDAEFSPRERATIAVARSLARVPCELTAEERADLEAQFSPAEAEWVVAGVVMMGFLNKFMDAIGVELEASTVAETAMTMGQDWNAGKSDGDLTDDLVGTAPPASDSILTKLAMIPKLPGALRLDAAWQKGVPSAWPQVGVFLTELCGHDFPVLSRLRHGRIIRAVAAMLRENLNPETSRLGLSTKVAAGLLFATLIEDAQLGADIEALAIGVGLDEEQVRAARALASDPTVVLPGADDKVQAVLLLARGASSSPAQITPDIVGRCRAMKVEPAEVIELVAWLSVLQMLHRLGSYYVAPDQG